MCCTDLFCQSHREKGKPLTSITVKAMQRNTECTQAEACALPQCNLNMPWIVICLLNIFLHVFFVLQGTIRRTAFPTFLCIISKHQPERPPMHASHSSFRSCVLIIT